MQTANFIFSECTKNTDEYNLYSQLRHKVFCDELKRVEWDGKICENGTEIEEDEYDANSVHIYARHLLTGIVAACCRLIMPSDIGISVMKRYQIDIPDGVSPDKTCEIGRVAIAPEFRRRRDDDKTNIIGDVTGGEKTPKNKYRQYPSELIFGLYSVITKSATGEGMTHALAAMDKIYTRNMLMAGFNFIPVGHQNDKIIPPRRPYILDAASVPETLEQIRIKSQLGVINS
jgi:N-acyl amino acid synthase of PEP-CTERM/exosortase system